MLGRAFFLPHLPLRDGSSLFTKQVDILFSSSYVPPVGIGETMVSTYLSPACPITCDDDGMTVFAPQRAGGLGTVMTDGKDLRKGDIVTGQFGWTEYVAVKESSVRKVTYVSVGRARTCSLAHISCTLHYQRTHMDAKADRQYGIHRLSGPSWNDW